MIDEAAVLKALEGDNLKDFLAYSTVLTDTILSRLADNWRLDWLVLNEVAGITSEGLAELKRIEQIRIVDLGGTDCDFSALQGAKFLGTLDQLSINNTNTLSDASCKWLVECENVSELDLSFTRIGDKTVERLTKYKILNRLNLAATQVTDDCLVSLANIGSLETLVLGRNAIKGHGIGGLANATRLSHLNLQETQIGPDCVEEILSLPQVNLQMPLHDTSMRQEDLKRIKLKHPKWITAIGPKPKD